MATPEEQPVTPEQPPTPEVAYSIGNVFATTSPSEPSPSPSPIQPSSFSPGFFEIYCGAVCLNLKGELMLIYDSIKESYYLPKREMIDSLSAEAAAFKRAKAASGIEFYALLVEDSDGNWREFRSPVGAGMAIADNGKLTVNLYYMAGNMTDHPTTVKAESPYQTLEWVNPMRGAEMVHHQDQRQAITKAAQILALHQPRQGKIPITEPLRQRTA